MHGNDEFNNARRNAQHTLEKLTQPSGFYSVERITTPTLAQMAADLDDLSRAIRNVLNDRLERRGSL